ncbi:hypothetical protein PQQ52_19650 [Paraburkholderia sediminicola]|uniref:hypothetical protein n=1 Tax=Paraburkholderia sediminicola TaxID=458836 RepID=UPI0038B87167
MKYSPFVFLIVLSAVCMMARASAHPEGGFDIAMLNPIEVSTTSVASEMSVAENDFPLVAYRLPPIVHGPAYYPAWRDGMPRGRRRFEYLRGGRFFLHERDNDK